VVERRQLTERVWVELDAPGQGAAPLRPEE
jgi:hypothetical protein